MRRPVVLTWEILANGNMHSLRETGRWQLRGKVFRHEMRGKEASC